MQICIHMLVVNKVFRLTQKCIIFEKNQGQNQNGGFPF